VNISRDPFEFDVSAYPPLPPLPPLPGVFVTGTDTEVGKTVIAGAVARSLRKGGRRVEVFKPVASGCRKRRGQFVSDDAQFLAWCAESRRRPEEIVPVRLGPALAPNVAAQRSGRPISLEKIFSAYAELDGLCDAVVVEGVGGLLCPITDEFWVIHLAKMTRLPLLIVARPGLGTINHTLLTIHAARAAGIEIAGVIINRCQLEPKLTEAEAALRGDVVLAMHTNPDQIAERGDVEMLAVVCDDPATSIEKCTLGEDTQFAVDRVDWPRLLRLPPPALAG
jgi:dethiobiotin synthetase